MTGDFKTGYTLYIDTDLELYGQVEELENIINTMIPENLVVVSKNSIPCNIKGAVLFGGGIVQTEMLNITNDSQETVSVQGTVNFGGRAADTAMVTISTDFNETIRADMDAKAASGVVQVDFIEIKTT